MSGINGDCDSLNALLRQGRWEEAHERIATNPFDVYQSQPLDGKTSLHTVLALEIDDDDECDDTDEDEDEDEEDEERSLTIEISVNLVRKIIDASLHVDASKDNSAPLLLSRDFNHNTPLHSLCGRGSASPILLELIFGYCTDFDNDEQMPSALDLITATNAQGCTPLHFLSECRCDVESIKIMLHHCTSLREDTDSLTLPIEPTLLPKDFFYDENAPKPANIHPCLIQDEDGDSPLHYAFGVGASLEYIQPLLEHCPRAITLRNIDGKLPLDDLLYWASSYWLEMYDDHFHPYEFIRRKNKNHLLTTGLFNDQEQEIQSGSDSKLMSEKWYGMKKRFQKHFWDILNIYIEISCFGTNQRFNKENGSIWKPIHAVATLTHCPSIVILFGLHMCPDEMRAHDENGKLPFHCAVSTPSTHASPLSNISILCNQDQDINLCKQKTICKDHMLPLHLAIETGKDMEVILEIYKRYPDALEAIPSKNGLYPWMLAALDDNNTIDVVYSLLRMNPELVRDGIFARTD